MALLESTDEVPGHHHETAAESAVHEMLENLPDVVGWENPTERLAAAPSTVRDFILRWGHAAEPCLASGGALMPAGFSPGPALLCALLWQHCFEAPPPPGGTQPSKKPAAAPSHHPCRWGRRDGIDAAAKA